MPAGEEQRWVGGWGGGDTCVLVPVVCRCLANDNIFRQTRSASSHLAALLAATWGWGWGGEGGGSGWTMAPVKSAKCTRKGAALAGAARTRRRQQEVWGRSYVDALRTVHLAGGEAVTVSSGLADNMAKGIHLQRRARAHRRSGQTKARRTKTAERGERSGR